MRIDAYIFFSQEDECIHMFTYRKNINAEKEKEIRASFDEMTGFLNKMETGREITALLSRPPDGVYAFFLFDIDNFKQANDSCGHAFGDYCIREFTSIIRKHFRVNDVLGRVGGDEFAAFIPAPDSEWVEDKAKELSNALRVTCTEGGKSWEMSASIGVSIASIDGNDFDTLYQKADAALYQTKQRGKNGYTIA